MKKVGNFFLMFVPSIVVLSFQYFAMFFIMGICMLFLFAKGQGFMEAYNSMVEFLLNPDVNLTLLLMFSTMTICSCGLLCHYRYGGGIVPPEKKEFNPLQFAGILLIVPGAQILSNLMVSVIAALMPSALTAYEELLEASGMGDELSIAMILYSVILAPIGEELAFRGLTLRIGRKALPFWAANLIQAFLFGVFHMNIIQGSYAFVLGLILGFVCEKGGSIYYAIFLHFLFNFWGTIIAPFVAELTHPTAILLFFAAVIACTIIGLLLFIKGMKQKEAKRLRPIQLENVHA